MQSNKLNRFLRISLLVSFCGTGQGVLHAQPGTEGIRTCDCRAEETAWSEGIILYISPDGDDRNEGSIKKPFATLERAGRAIEENKDQPVTVLLRQGYYSLARTFTLDKKRMQGEFPVLITSFPGETAHITGGMKIDGFEPLDRLSEEYNKFDPEIRDQVYRVDLTKRGITDYGQLTARGFGRPIQPSGLELYFNEKPMTLARWPNDSWTTIAAIPEELERKGFTYPGDRPARWLNAPDLWLHGYWKYDWSDNYVKVAAIDTVLKRIITEPPYSNYPYSKGKRFYALNLLEELDTAGEWYLDRKCGILYFWPPADPDTAKVFISLLREPLIRINGLNHVTIKHIIFEYTCASGIEIIGGNHNIIDGCILRNIGTVTVSIGKLAPNLGSLIYNNTLYNGEAGHYNGVRNCQIYAAGEGGIILGGGDRETLTAGNNFAFNNNIRDCCRWVRTYRAGVFLYGVGNIVKNNRIHDLPHTAVFFWGNEHLMEYNEIDHVCMETGDAGAFYNGRDWTQRGSIIRYNYFHHLHGVEGQGGFTDVMAVYMDDWASGTTVFGNVFYKAGRTVMIGGGRDNLVENNIIIDGSPAIHVDARGMGWAKYYFDGSDSTLFKRLAAVHPANPPYSQRYPSLKNIPDDAPALPKGNKIIRNICSGGKWIEFHNAETEPLVYLLDNRPDVDKKLLINNDDMLKIEYDLINLPPGFRPIPLKEIGIRYCGAW